MCYNNIVTNVSLKGTYSFGLEETKKLKELPGIGTCLGVWQFTAVWRAAKTMFPMS